MNSSDSSWGAQAKGLIGFANGCWDLFHDGHRRFLCEARSQCDYLIVAVNSDASVRRLKGEGRPSWGINARIGPIKDYAQAVFPFEGDEMALIMSIRPHIVFKGFDHSTAPIFYRRKGWKWETRKHWFEGPEIIQIPRHGDFSTTGILREQKADAGPSSPGLS